jgi:hypothetical protein
MHAACGQLRLRRRTERDADGDDCGVGVHRAGAAVKGHAHAEQADGVGDEGDDEDALAGDRRDATGLELRGEP